MLNKPERNLDEQSSDAGPKGRPRMSQVASSGDAAARQSGNWLVQRLFDLAGHPPVAVRLWDGSEYASTQREPVARLHIRDRRALQKLLGNPHYEFGELYSAGRIEVEGNLAEFLDVVYRHLERVRRDGLRGRLVRLLARRQGNTEDRARHNITHHYDIGNDFYRLWLDEDMVYTCAYFPHPEASLEAAQTAKLDHVCRKLRLQPGQRVAEAGCGWGALALHMARNYGVSVKAYNISREQLAFARERAKAEGLDDRVEFVEDDYRAIRGEFDAFVSVGMLEHVGVDNYGALGETIDRVLAPDGRGLIHTIGRDAPGPMNEWIERRIFPGAYPPSLSEITEILEPSGLSVLDVENIRLHYARTLQHWWERYEANADKIRGMFDETFFRAWRLYLAGSIAAFTSGGLQLFQVVFNRHGSNELPWTRDYIYREPA